MIRANSAILKQHFQASNIIRKFAAQVASSPTVESLSKQEWSSAQPFSKIPGPSKLALVIGNMLPSNNPSNLKTSQLADIMTTLRNRYGDIFKIPGMFGKPEMVVVFDPKDFELIYRTEGVWPVRRSLESIEYYRKKIRPDIFHNGGLGIEQGKAWADFRSAANPVMMQPKIVKLYVPRIDTVAAEFMDRMRIIRDPKTLELPDNFEDELNRWTLEAICIIALDTRLGLIGKLDKNSREQEFINAVKTFFRLIVELDIKPSMWKVFPTRNFKEMMRVQDILAKFAHHYVEKAKKRFETIESKHNENEQSVLEKLVKIDPNVATVMAMDMISAGVDTTSSAVVGTLYNLAKNPDKQENLLKELRTILPDKSSPLTPQNMSNLPYLRACIKESFRLHPVVNGNSRSVGQDLVLKGYQIPKGTTVLLQSLNIQRSDEAFLNANSFIPERWLKKDKSEISEQAKNTNPFTFLPFGFGPRMCIGRRFAELEIEVFLSRVIRNFHVEWNKPELKFKSVAINVPDGKLQFKITDVDS